MTLHSDPAREFAKDAMAADLADAGFPSITSRANLRDEVVRTLQAAVISGDMRPGVTYSAPQLAQHFGVSATPVREAMLHLVKEGLVVTVPNKGFRVVELSEHELDELTELRQLVEIPTVRTIAERGVEPTVLRRLRDLADRVVESAGRRDFVEHNKLDLEFHALLMAQAGNRNLVDLVNSLRTRSRLYGTAELGLDELAPTLREHDELLDLIEAGDAEGAASVMRRHIGHVRKEWAARRTPDDPRADDPRADEVS